MATFYNQATLSYGGTVTNSNITSGEIVTGLSLTKTAASADYGHGDGITYVVSIVNGGSNAYNWLVLTDDLGAYSLDGTNILVPLTYIEGSVLYYQNGVLQEAPEVLAGDTLTISGITVPAGGNVIVIYEARANEFAPLNASSSIYNTVTANGAGGDTALTDSASVATRDEPSLSIAKAVSPAVITDDGEITYTIIVQNTGNTAIVATDNVVIGDIFNPVIRDIEVCLDGTLLTEGVGYNYDEASGSFTTTEGAITVPAASFTRDPESGVVTTTPGVTVLTVSGRIN